MWSSTWTQLLGMWQNEASLTIGVHVVAWHLWRCETLLKRVCAITALLHCYNLLLWWCKWCVRCHHPFHSVGHYFCKAKRRQSYCWEQGRTRANNEPQQMQSEKLPKFCLSVELWAISWKTCNFWLHNFWTPLVLDPILPKSVYSVWQPSYSLTSAGPSFCSG